MKKYFKYKFENMNKWISAILSVILLFSIICPVIANYYTNDRSSSTVLVNNNSQQQKEIQKETFKDINQNDLSNIIDSDEFISNITNPSETYASHFSSGVSTSSNEIAKLNPGKKITDIKEFDEKDFKIEVKDNSKKILAGDLLIGDLKNKANKTLKDQKTFANMPDYLNDFLNNHPDSNMDNTSTEQNTNVFYNINTTSNQVQNDLKDITYSDLKFIANIDKSILNLSNYRDCLKKTAIATTALTVVAWGVVAFYLGCWWWFGANIPFAAAAIVQAATLTVSTDSSWKSYNNICNDLVRLEETKNLIGTQNILEIQKILSKYTKEDLSKWINTNYIVLSTIEKVSIKWIIPIFKYILSVNNFFKTKFCQRVLAYIAKCSANRAVVITTSWANGIAIFITIVDIAITIANLSLSWIYGI